MTKRNGARVSARTRRIASLNDQLRKNPFDRQYGQVLISAGIAAKGETFQQHVLAAISAMTPKDYKKGNDPYKERDFNAFTVAGRLCLYKIDYYQKDDQRRMSEDPADPQKTDRVMTVMFANEY